MSLEDPFFVVRDEVQKAVQSSQNLYDRWCDLLNNPKSVSKEEYDWTTNELRNSLRSIEWDLEDLEETVDILLCSKRMKDHLSSPQASSKEQSSVRQVIVKTQDEHLDLIGSSVGVLKNMSQNIGNELDEQNVMLDDFHHEMDTTESKLDTTMKKMAKVLHMSNDRRQWCAIFSLLGVLLIVIILFIVL
ncbi:hypothetical protein KUTeg_021398 [Tegillarca granosa]|uniref:t-SNARE coiled-coil homology domain-containing protein n=1 Tax=Tegillarca granosa TaxID=220873 RepID=A0ABQ9E6D9_TEGGR|nr:hypothetical protein KUTeg_021398 [Tegillarca granosa]